jgi:hypothetical protein
LARKRHPKARDLIASTRCSVEHDLLDEWREAERESATGADFRPGEAETMYLLTPTPKLRASKSDVTLQIPGGT